MKLTRVSHLVESVGAESVDEGGLPNPGIAESDEGEVVGGDHLAPVHGHPHWGGVVRHWRSHVILATVWLTLRSHSAKSRLSDWWTSGHVTTVNIVGEVPPLSSPSPSSMNQVIFFIMKWMLITRSCESKSDYKIPDKIFYVIIKHNFIGELRQIRNLGCSQEELLLFYSVFSNLYLCFTDKYT